MVCDIRGINKSYIVDPLYSEYRYCEPGTSFGPGGVSQQILRSGCHNWHTHTYCYQKF